MSADYRIAKCAYCGKEIWGSDESWAHEDTGLGSAPTDEWCRVSPDNRHHHTRSAGEPDDADIPPDCERLAKDVLEVAACGGMPDSYWHTDARILRACVALGWTPVEAREWAYSDH